MRDFPDPAGPIRMSTGRPLVMMPNTAAAWSPRSPPANSRPSDSASSSSPGIVAAAAGRDAAGQRREIGGESAERGG